MFRRRRRPSQQSAGQHGTSRDGCRFPYRPPRRFHAFRRIDSSFTYDLLSHRALLSCGRKAYSCRTSTRPRKWQIAAQKFAWKNWTEQSGPAGCRTPAISRSGCADELQQVDQWPCASASDQWPVFARPRPACMADCHTVTAGPSAREWGPCSAAAPRRLPCGHPRRGAALDLGILTGG